MEYSALAEARAKGFVTPAEAPHRVGKVTLIVRDLDRTSEFYRTVVGLEIIEREPGHVRLGASGFVLLELRHDPGAQPRNRRDTGLFHTAFLLPTRADLGAWLTSARERGTRLTGASDHLVSEAVDLDDPEGNGVEIYVDRPRSDWVQSDGSIRMTSDPVDLDAIVAAAGSQQWRGFPEAGVVGHVHLQVGDLDEAEAFYRGVLGLNVTSQYPGARFFGSGGYHHQLAANVWKSAGAGVRPERAAGLAEIELIVAGEVLEAVRTTGSAKSDHGSTTSITVHDPWGTPITLRSMLKY